MKWISREEFLGFEKEPVFTNNDFIEYKIPWMSMQSYADKVLYARRVIQGIDTVDNPSLFIRGGGKIMAVYLNEKKITWQLLPKENSDDFIFNTAYFPVIPLNPEDEGKVLSVFFYAEKNFPVGFTEAPIVATQSENYKAVANRNQIFASLGFFFFALGIFSSYLYLRRKKRAIIAFTLFSLVSGIHFMAQVGFWGYFYYDSYNANFYIFTLSLFFIPVTGLYFFDKLFGLGRGNIIRMLWQFQFLFSSSVLCLAHFEVITYPIAFMTFLWVVAPSLLMQIFVSLGEFFLKKPRAWILVLGSIALLLFNLHDVMATLGKINSINRLSPWGFFLFVVSLSLYGEEVFRNSEVKFAALQREIVTAARIQNAILPPKAPAWTDLEVAVYYQPSHEVGGDFYDLQALGDKKYGILIADVVGHGLGASIIASLSKFSFFQNFIHWKNPSFLLSAMNEYLVSRSNGRFTTAAYFYFDMEKHKLVVANAGHPSFLHYSHHSDTIFEIKPKGKPLGIFESLTYLEEEFTFDPGDSFLFYTDGLTEETGVGSQEFGLEELKTIFKRTLQDKSQVSLESLVQQFQDVIQLEGLPHDDITILFVRIPK
ncbi:stage II sporulation protein E [Leptospira ryugenii]|uniref:Stage II sporulation protein E n=1 Tax=Leptospira ryugenii TaxID=1917863 RepID=A0A2P2DYP4_9LEPT|nr:SpoIIE family protein phosphatase [Leptospira ryugenii]GBF49745.1 stage II sporulation protein E [Leptospira ryugenii]